MIAFNEDARPPTCCRSSGSRQVIYVVCSFRLSLTFPVYSNAYPDNHHLSFTPLGITLCPFILFREGVFLVNRVQLRCLYCGTHKLHLRHDRLVCPAFPPTSHSLSFQGIYGVIVRHNIFPLIDL